MKRATIFAIAVCLVGWAVALIYNSVASAAGSFGYSIFGALYMFIPMLTALAMQCCKKCKGEEADRYKEMLRFRPRWSWLAGIGVVLVAIFLSLGLAGLFIDIVSMKEGTLAQLQAAGLSPEVVEQNMAQLALVPDWAMMFGTIVSGLFAGVTINALFAFGEEYGWRYFMVRGLAGKKFIPSALIIGAVWGIWHAPMILLFGHNYPNDRVLGVAMMVIFCIAGGIVELYFVLKAGSVWPAVLIHGVMNAIAGITVLMIGTESVVLYAFMGVAGIVALLLTSGALYLYDRFVSHDNIFGSTLGASLDRNKE
ncbi:MAG: CPBP family intramembrane metalloprotease [Tidjanibacter sp.]|nr:CPBP family intramembrane metalloprotease [Tidjanibacter sp.]